MNPIFIQSWHFLQNNLKPISWFILPFAMISIISDFIGIANPESSIKPSIDLTNMILIYPIYNGGILILIDHLARKQQVSTKEILSKVIPLWIPLFFVSLLSGLAIGLGLVMLIIPGLWLMLRLPLASLYVVFDQLSATQAIKASFDDSKPHLATFFFAFLPLVILSLTIIIFSVNFSFPFSPQLTDSYPLAILRTIIREFLFALTSIIQYRLYSLYIKSAS